MLCLTVYEFFHPYAWLAGFSAWTAFEDDFLAQTVIHSLLEHLSDTAKFQKFEV